MKRPEAYQGRAAGILSAVLLCLIAAVAIVGGPFADRTPYAFLSKQPTGGMSAEGQQTAPVIPKRPFASADWRVAKAAPHHDGKSKVALPPASAGLLSPGAGGEEDGFASQEASLLRSHPYEARAPPATS